MEGQGVRLEKRVGNVAIPGKWSTNANQIDLKKVLKTFLKCAYLFTWSYVSGEHVPSLVLVKGADDNQA